MLSTTSRTCLRSFPPRTFPQRQSLAQRFLSFGPPPKKHRSWRSSAARWGVAIGAIYIYNTSDFFSESLRRRIADLRRDHDSFSLVEPIDGSSREQHTAIVGGPAPSTSLSHRLVDRSDAPPAESLKDSSSSPFNTSAATNGTASASAGQSPDPGDPQELEEEAEGEGAFNPETGEINWDCPCLGGMAHGTCGPEFREAFSCFVYSNEDPKGIDCIDKFKAMQDCFRAHPDEYAEELAADPSEDDAADSAMAEPGAASTQSTPATPGSTSSAHDQQTPISSGPHSGPGPAPAPYSGATSPSSEVPGSNLTSTPSASPSSLSSSTGIPNSATSKQEADEEKELQSRRARSKAVEHSKS